VVNGVTYNTDNASVYSVTVEKDGNTRATLKLTGEFEDASSNSKFQHITRVSAYAGKNFIRIYHTVVFDEDMQDTVNEPSSWRIIVPLDGLGSSLNAAVGGSSIHTKSGLGATSNYHLHQKMAKTIGGVTGYDVGIDGYSPEYTGSQSMGWMDINDGSYGMTGFVRYAYEQFPVKLDLNSKVFSFYLWPNDDKTAVVGVMEDEVEAGRCSGLWPEQPGTNLSFRARGYSGGSWWTTPHNAIGIALTKEMVLYFHTGTHLTANPTSDDAVDIYGKEVIAWNVQHVLDTFALGPVGINPVDTEKYPKIENSLSDGFDAEAGTPSNNQMWGIHFGDSFYEGSGSTQGSGNRAYLNYRVNWQIVPWLLFARSGTRKYLDWAVPVTRHNMDIDTAHVDILLPLDAGHSNAWQSGQSYAINDRVRHDYTGSMINYICKQAHTSSSGNQPGLSTTYWATDPVKKATGGGLATHEIGPIHWHNQMGYESSTAAGALQRSMGMDSHPEPEYLYYFILGYKRSDDVGELIRARTMHADCATNYDSNPASRTSAGAFGPPIEAYLKNPSQGYIDYANARLTGLINSSYWRPDGWHDHCAAESAGLYDWPNMTTRWFINEFERYCRVSNNSTAKNLFEILSKSVGGMGLTSDGRATVMNHRFPVASYYYGYELTSDPSYLRYARHYSDIWDAWHNDVEGTSRLHGYTMYARSMIHWMYYADFYTLTDYDYPDFAPQSWQIPSVSSGNKLTFYVNETSDQNWDITLFLKSGAAMYSSWYNCGNVYINIYNPEGTLITSDSFDLGTLKIFDACNLDGTDRRIKKYNIPLDGKYGTNKIELTVDSASIGNANTPRAYILDCTFKGIKTPVDESNRFYMDTGKYYVWLPSDKSNVVVTHTGDWHTFGLHKPSGVSTNDSLLYSYNITADVGDRGRFWAVSLYGEEPGAVKAQIGGDLESFIYLNPNGGQFEISSIYSQQYHNFMGLQFGGASIR